MINQIDDKLSEWIKPLANGRELSFSLPTGPGGDLTIHLYLLDITDDPFRLNTSRPPKQPSLRYLLTTSAADPLMAHELLSTLLFAALENPDYEVEFEAASSPLWIALQIPPRPAFFIRIPLTHEWPPLQGYRVKEVAVGMSGLIWLYGQVLGPGDVPITEARVDLKELNKYAYTDLQGRFTIPGIPDATSAKKLIITARGSEQSYTFNETGTLDTPQIFHIDIPELPH